MNDESLDIMRCPECDGEFRPGIIECPDCEVFLVPASSLLPRRTPHPPAYTLVPVLETGNPALLAVAQSLLTGSGIDYETAGDALQDFFAMGRLGAGFNPVVGGAKLLVRDHDAEAARELLSELEDEPDRDWESLGDD